MTCWSCRGNSARSRVPQGASPCPPPRRATVPTWGRTAAAASRRPWLRRPRAAAQGNAGGSAPPRARRSHSGRPGAAIGPARHVGSPPGRASPARVTLHLRPQPPSPVPAREPGARPLPRSRKSWSPHWEHPRPGRTLATCRAGTLFGAYFSVEPLGEESFL